MAYEVIFKTVNSTFEGHVWIECATRPNGEKKYFVRNQHNTAMFDKWGNAYINARKKLEFHKYCYQCAGLSNAVLELAEDIHALDIENATQKEIMEN